MIITLTKADFSLCKIGTLTTFNVRKSTVIGASVNIIKTSVERAGYSSATTIATIVLDKANYEGHAIKVMMGSTDVSSWYSVGNIIVPANTPITSNITISVSATAVSGGDPIIPDVPDTPDEPVTPTMYTFTINPTPSTATVTLTASGYSQSGNSISVASGTSVSWEVSANGYDTIKGTHDITENKTLDVEITDLTNAEKIDTSEENVVVGKWINVEKGAEKDLAQWRTTNFVEIPSGATHVYSNDITLYRLAGNNTTPYGFYDNEKNYVSGIPLDVYPVGVQVPPGAKGKWRGVLKWPIPEGVKYVRVCWTHPGSGYVHELTGIKSVTVASPDVYFLKNN